MATPSSFVHHTFKCATNTELVSNLPCCRRLEFKPDLKTMFILDILFNTVIKWIRNKNKHLEIGNDLSLSFDIPLHWSGVSNLVWNDLTIMCYQNIDWHLFFFFFFFFDRPTSKEYKMWTWSGVDQAFCCHNTLPATAQRLYSQYISHF